ncbi:MAG: hypothetical protein LBK46_06865 [Oscillospiraceae bacterium]|jgi:hypothetical protein|nr:hypothetical protein [Oscillospiraceae bacterium]
MEAMNSPSKKLKRKWRACVGAGEAADGLRADWQNQFCMAARKCAFERARISGWNRLDARYSREIDALCDFLTDLNISPVARLNDNDACENLDSFARHVIARYGAKRAHSWRFEIPYNSKFVKHAQKLKRMDPDLSAGALITGGSPRRIMSERGGLSGGAPGGSKPDFIVIGGDQEYATRLRREIDEMNLDIPVHWDAVCETHSAEEGLRDAIALTRRYLAGDALSEPLDSMALASFSGLCGAGAYLIDNWGVQQPAAHAYRMLDALGDELVERGDGWALTRDMLGRMTALAWYEPDSPKEVLLKGMRPYSRMMIETLDSGNGWAYSVWRRMGMPDSLARHQVQALRQAAQNTCVSWSRTNEDGIFSLELPRAESIVLIKEQ